MGSTKYPPLPTLTGGTPGLPTQGQPAPLRPGEFASASIANFTSFAWDKIGPPSTLYVQRDDVIFIDVVSSIANESVFVTGRFLPAPLPVGGQPSDEPTLEANPTLTNKLPLTNIGQLVQTASAFSDVRTQLVLGEGYLLSLAAVATATPERGETFVRATLVRPGTNLFRASTVLFADYVGQLFSAGWPNGRSLSSIEGPGFLHRVTVTNPAAGADWTLTMGTNQRMRIISLEASLAVANSGAARPVEIVADDGVGIYARMATNVAAPINATAAINFSNSGTPSTSIASDIYAQMPAGLMLPPTHRLRSLTTNIVAGDQWSNILLLVEEWIDGF